VRNPFTSAVALSAALPALFQPQIEPWVDRSNLEALVWSDVFGSTSTDALPMTRHAAIAVPAVARARHLTAGTIAKLPLETFTGAALTADQPYWCQGSNGQTGDLDATARRRYGVAPQSTWHRMLWTIDDFLFYGRSLWLVTRFLASGWPAEMARVPAAYWAVDDDGVVVDQDSQPIDPARVVLLEGPHEGILTTAHRTIRAAAALEVTAADVARRPFRLEIHQTTDVVLDASERAAIVAEARRALADNNGVLFTNAAIETKDHPLDSGELLIAGRNASALDVARHVSMPAAMIDAVATGASLEYDTALARNQQWIDYGLALYMDAATSRLGMDDIVPRGQRIAFDTEDLTRAPPQAPAGFPTTD
jgi:hypothetical protein